MLEYYLANLLDKNPQNSFLMAFFFARVAEGKREVLRDYEAPTGYGSTIWIDPPEPWLILETSTPTK